MEEIYSKLHELYELLKEIPEDCKGNSNDAHCNRRKYIAVKIRIHELIEML